MGGHPFRIWRSIKRRTVISYEHLTILKQIFKDDPRPSKEVRLRLAECLGLTEQTIRIWFQNHRTKARSKINFALPTTRTPNLDSTQTFLSPDLVSSETFSPETFPTPHFTTCDHLNFTTHPNQYNHLNFTTHPTQYNLVLQPFGEERNLLEGFMTAQEFDTIAPIYCSQPLTNLPLDFQPFL
ncbi:hypothetical protein L0F63_006687 [Massospora cicadina]|nr:hypothetical protein L0F63_006687 [Massospora cicadina]